MKLNYRKTPDGTTLWEFRTTKTDDVRTLYFALREYRDNLHKSLIEAVSKNLEEDDYVVNPETKFSCGCCTLRDCNMTDNLISEVPQVKPVVLFNDSTEYEDLMFLHETLSKVNEALFEITQNHRSEVLSEVTQELDV